MSLSVSGFRVRQARIIRARSSGELAKSLGWPASKLSRLENSSDSEISIETLGLIADELDFRPEFFTYERAEELLDSDLLFRAPKSMLKRERQYLADYAALAGEVIEWVDSFHRLPGVRLPHTLIRGQSVSDEEIVYAAMTARLALGVKAEEPVPYLTHLMERAGITVLSRGRGLHPDDSEAFDKDATSLEKHIGYSTWVGTNRDRPLVVTRSLSSWERTRWTLAHEVGHLMLHRGRISPTAEDEASKFASEFLFPRSNLEKRLPRTFTLSTLLPLKLEWGISLYALLRHMRSSALLMEDQYISLTRQLHVRKNHETGRTWRNDEPGWDAREPESPAMLRTWFERCLGTSDPNALAALAKVWPDDLFAEMLSNQRRPNAKVRPHPATRVGGYESQTIVDLASRRRA